MPTSVQTPFSDNDLFVYEVFEYFVGITDGVWWWFQANTHLHGVVTALMVLAIWLVFNHHLNVLKTSTFFEENVQIAGRFCLVTYDCWRLLAMSLPPVAVGIFIYCVLTRWRTSAFISAFGIRGSSKQKRMLIRKSMRKLKT